MIKIISFKVCPFVQRVTALLEAKNVSFEVEFIDMENIPQWFAELSPNAQVPVMITEDGQTLFESEAIVEYIEEITPPIEADVSPEQRAKDRAWGYQASNHYLIQCAALRSPDRETLAKTKEKLDEAFSKAEKELGSGPFFKGEKISNVDIAWLPLLHRASLFQRYTCFDFLESFPKVKAWQEAIMKTGLVEKSVSRDFEEAFQSVYLMNKSFLES
ncbi:glutathione S-transferase family protein [Vibrio fluvialis]|jgi:glutathione S-transferase|uniref:glutathione S-transferase family protein n=1 Tax=Gammaproteobacteria TaxID=1236 RepID=UPI001A1E0CC1|nr:MULTISPECIES: glutathione S-transferase family protein [Gammaproteobacteria]MCR9297684.1 glutathione S-transferase family protein [Vibrio fluvialis]MDN3385118.1 glutathione S-transferase family protein [Pseudoalteromonas sp. APC 3358]HAU5615018.1 glutathione S-transferase family protein [Morganella morganii]HDQ2579460.1 glutathione S-transferase family protein [Morganella morganii]